MSDLSDELSDYARRNDIPPEGEQTLDRMLQRVESGREYGE